MVRVGMLLAVNSYGHTVHDLQKYAITLNRRVRSERSSGGCSHASTGSKDHVSLPPIEGSKRGASYRCPTPAVGLPWTSMSGHIITISGHALPALVVSMFPLQQRGSNYGYLYELVSKPLEIQASIIPSFLLVRSNSKTQLTRILESHHGAFGHSCTRLDLSKYQQNTMWSRRVGEQRTVRSSQPSDRCGCRLGPILHHQRGTHRHKKTHPCCLHGCWLLRADDGYHVQPKDAA
jgi:hypothetical protein